MPLPATLLFGLITSLSVSMPADAQLRTAPAERPVQGLFGSGGRTTIGLGIQTYSGFDDTQVRVTTPTADFRSISDGRYVGNTVRLNLGRPVGRGTVQVNGMSDLRYYPESGALQSLTANTSFGGVSIGHPIKRNGAFRLSQSFGAASFFQFNPFSGFGAGGVENLLLPTSDFQIGRGRTFNYDLSAGTDWRLGRRDLLTLDYGLRHVNFPGEELRLLSNRGGVRLSHTATRTLSVIAGYGFERASALVGSPAQYHRIDSGLEYRVALFDNTTTFSTSGGAAIVAARDVQTDAIEHVVQLLVFAALQREVTRSWSASLDYRREPQVVEIFATPVYSDSVFGSLGGRLGRRVGLRLSGGYSRSVQNAGRGDLANEFYFGTARADWTIVRALSIFGEYAHFRFRNAPTSLSTVPVSRIARQAIRFGLGWSLPLLTTGAPR